MMGARKWCQDMRFRNVKTRENGTKQWNNIGTTQGVGRIEDGLGSSFSACRSHLCVQPVSLGDI
jgi:hypothetical protein